VTCVHLCSCHKSTEARADPTHFVVFCSNLRLPTTHSLPSVVIPLAGIRRLGTPATLMVLNYHLSSRRCFRYRTKATPPDGWSRSRLTLSPPFTNPRPGCPSYCPSCCPRRPSCCPSPGRPSPRRPSPSCCPRRGRPRRGRPSCQTSRSETHYRRTYPNYPSFSHLLMFGPILGIYTI
jgi:hypothetical protein